MNRIALEVSSQELAWILGSLRYTARTANLGARSRLPEEDVFSNSGLCRPPTFGVELDTLCEDLNMRAAGMVTSGGY